MTKYDFRIRRQVFRKGNIKSKRDFDRFEQHFQQRRKKEVKQRNSILMIGVIVLTIILLFTFRAFSYDARAFPETNIVVTNKIL